MYCKKVSSLTQTASYFGIGINESSSNTIKCNEELLKNKLFKKQIQEIESLLNKNTKTKV